MRKYVQVTAALAAGLFVVSMSANSEARYSFGRLKNVAGGVIAKAVPACAAKVDDNIKAEIIQNNVVTGTYWGAAAQAQAQSIGAPVEIDDDGVNTCAQYSGNLYLHFLLNGQDFWLQGQSNNFHNPIEIDDPRIGWDGWGTGWVMVGKEVGLKWTPSFGPLARLVKVEAAPV